VTLSRSVAVGPTRYVLVLTCCLSVAVSVLPIDMGLVLAITAPGLVLIASHPEALAVVLPLLIPASYVAGLTVGGLTVGLVDVTIAVLVLGWLARGVRLRRIVVQFQGLGVLLAMWLAVVALSLLRTKSLVLGLGESIKWAEVLLIYIIAVSSLRKKDLRWLVYAIAAAGAGSAVMGLVQFVRARGPEGFMILGRFMRAYGTFRQPNPYGGHLGLSLPFAMAWALVGARRWSVEQLALLAATGLMGLGIVASWSRGAWLGVLVAVGLVGFLMSPRTFLVILVLGLGVAFAANVDVGSSPLLQRVLSMGTDIRQLNVADIEVTAQNFAVVERLAHWQAGWYMFAARPWLGVGIGNYEAQYQVYALPRWPNPLGHAHNYYLNVAAETGLVGLAAFVALGLGVWLAVRNAWRACRDGASRALVLGAGGSMAHLGVQNLVDNLFVHGLQVLVGLSLAILVIVKVRGECDSEKG